MNPTEIIRHLLRQILIFLTTQAVKKHKPLIIVILGEKNSSLIRELTYSICQTEYNTRRNLEKTDSEFSIPLTALGELYYPNKKIGWINILIKNVLRILYLKPYKHALVIQIHKITKPIQKTWLNALNPDIVISTDMTKSKDWINLNLRDFELLKKGKLTKEIQRFLINSSVSQENAQEALKDSSQLQQRINIIRGKNDSLIVDARHFYHPPNLCAVIETIKDLPGEKYLITEVKSDLKEIPNDYSIVENLNELNLQKGAIYIFRGSKKSYTDEIRELSEEELAT